MLSNTHKMKAYKFEGHLIYQLRNENASITDLRSEFSPINRAADVENYRSNGTAIGQLINWEYSDALATSVPVEKVAGSNEGIYHLRLLRRPFCDRSTTL